jgi:hypothetical protein
MSFLIAISIIFFNSCLETDVDYALPFEEKPVAIGFIDSVNGARVFVGKNANIFSKDSSTIKKSSVSLWANDTLVENLFLLEKNVFTSSNNFKINPNNRYYFKANSPLSIDTLFSDKIAVPNTVAIEKVSYQFINTQRTRINIYIEIKDPIGFNAYAFNVQRFKKDTAFDIKISENPLFIPISGQIINDAEFNGNQHTFTIENVSIEVVSNRRFILMDNLKITLFNLSKPTFDLFQTLRTSEPTTGDPFFEPNILPNQLKNGVGSLGAYSSFTYTLKI